MTDSAKPAPRVLRRQSNDNVSQETRVMREIESEAELFTGELANGRVVTLREMNAGDLLYLEKSLGRAGDMERSLKLAARLSCGEGRVTFDDLSSLSMKDLKVITKLVTQAGDSGEEEEDEDLYPND